MEGINFRRQVEEVYLIEFRSSQEVKKLNWGYLRENKPRFYHKKENKVYPVNLINWRDEVVECVEVEVDEIIRILFKFEEGIIFFEEKIQDEDYNIEISD